MHFIALIISIINKAFYIFKQFVNFFLLYTRKIAALPAAFSIFCRGMQVSAASLGPKVLEIHLKIFAEIHWDNF